MRIFYLLVSALISCAVFAQGVIDVHSHIVTPEFLTHLSQHDALLDEGFPIPHYETMTQIFNKK